MEPSSRQDGGGENIPIPINISSVGTVNGHGGAHNMIHHHNQLHNVITSSTVAVAVAVAAPHNNPCSNGTTVGEVDESSYKKVDVVVVRYRECLKNHAAAMGGNATDGCGEFMPNGEEGTIEALICSACHCHRNFHRKEVEGGGGGSITDDMLDNYHHHHSSNFNFNFNNRKFMLPALPDPHIGYHPTAAAAAGNNNSNILPSRVVPPHVHGHGHIIMPFNYNIPSLPSESDEQEEGRHTQVPVVKKRFRTKFTQEQKDKMLSFAEKVGWKIQKQEESLVQQFCQEIGVRRRVLKVWMHNNKHNLAKKLHTNLPPTTSA
ncbi:zinc-finger homeodomain protein 2 [Cicer arietinum]|uniref:Zinc-finger homeodomain protein 2 n=1 Tax=Cicer arietinum TaxID=3827 RepID=A0A1S2Y4Y2_CICAR|nr:zinc-finger homeodomain protein 2 [Cicer arietinum]